jgi:hypothetical protein
MGNRLNLFISMSVVTGALLVTPAIVRSQQIPPIRGTIALKGTVDKVYKGTNTVIVKTEDGVEHLVHLTGRTAVHGGELDGLEKGRIVIVHYVPAGAEETAEEIDQVGENGLKTTEGVVTNVNRKEKTISIRLPNGTNQTLRLTDRAASDAGKDLDSGHGDTKVVVYFEDGSGSRVAHYFQKVS